MSDGFDYENAKQDILDNGGDPDYLSYHNASSRDSYMEKMGLDPDDYKNRSSRNQDSGDSDSQGCYIATAVYGSYDCPPVWTLRRFRDYKLARHWYGRLFIKVYYAISPKLIRKFGNTGWFQKIWRIRLDKMVSSLLDKGYEDTPYND